GFQALRRQFRGGHGQSDGCAKGSYTPETLGLGWHVFLLENGPWRDLPGKSIPSCTVSTCGQTRITRTRAGQSEDGSSIAEPFDYSERAAVQCVSQRILIVHSHSNGLLWTRWPRSAAARRGTPAVGGRGHYSWASPQIGRGWPVAHLNCQP